MSEITREQIQRFMEGSGGDNPRYTKETLQAYLDNPVSILDKAVYSLTIDYTKSVEEMVSAGYYDYYDPNITSENFPFEEEGQVEIQAEIVHFNRDIDSDDVIAELDKRGLRPATLAELFAFGATYPYVQLQFLIVALGSTWRCTGGNYGAGYLNCDDSGRYLALCWFKRGWNEECRFLAVRKTPPRSPWTHKVLGRFPLGNKICEVLCFHKPSEDYVHSCLMMYRGKISEANMSREDCQFFLRYRKQIPEKFSGKQFVFPKWSKSSCSFKVRYLFCNPSNGRWYQRWWPLTFDWSNDFDFVLVRFHNLNVRK